MALIDKLTNIANAIRNKTGKGKPMTLEQMAEEINGLQIGSNEQENGLVARTLTEYYNDTVTEIGTYAFAGFSILKSASFPNVTKISGTYSFYLCKSLETIYLPKLTTGLGSANNFTNCSALKELILPSYTDSSLVGISGCTSLAKVDLNSCSVIAGNCFYNDSNLSTLIIRNRKSNLQNINAFSGTPIESGTGYIYVPKALIEQYKVATNWITYAEQFRAIEDYPEICGGAEND